MATKLKQDDIVQRAVDGAFLGALAHIKKYAPHEFEELLSDPVKLEALVHAARKAAEEEVNLAEEIRAGPCDDIEARLLKQLPKHRVDPIKTGLEVPTYGLDIQKTHESGRPPRGQHHSRWKAVLDGVHRAEWCCCIRKGILDSDC